MKQQLARIEALIPIPSRLAQVPVQTHTRTISSHHHDVIECTGEDPDIPTSALPQPVQRSQPSPIPTRRPRPSHPPALVIDTSKSSWRVRSASCKRCALETLLLARKAIDEAIERLRSRMSVSRLHRLCRIPSIRLRLGSSRSMSSWTDVLALPGTEVLCCSSARLREFFQESKWPRLCTAASNYCSILPFTTHPIHPLRLPTTMFTLFAHRYAFRAYLLCSCLLCYALSPVYQITYCFAIVDSRTTSLLLADSRPVHQRVLLECRIQLSHV
ncbi:hypothetical protein PYCCODRAFT_852181 [Trametes coccinea BRFM310]|uniref:Uncharacterized protein n=1 Tax=Trametes coccinea (strain BRFM310) TaxID=1353009 RepID=A0A1Y2IDQ6_TRAC3|nr:hypothetical protein PYCCODRAFT_852181 [Trametes coccinea BRFM310]